MRFRPILLICCFASAFYCSVSLAAGDYSEEEAQMIAEACIQSGECGETSNLTHDKTTKLLSGDISLLQTDRTEITANENNIDGLLVNLGAEMSENEIRIILESGVLFTFDKYDLRPDAILILNKVLEILRYDDFTNEAIRIEGHTDSIGSHQYNDELSQMRAKSVVDWFVSNGISGSRISSSGYGETQPIDTNETDEGRQNNRRVEIKISRSEKR
jgi:outer membrane protein OmpA-like peptidoglycan-associated protein